MKRCVLLAWALLLGLPGLVAAQDKHPMEPFIGHETVFVARVDLKRADLKAIGAEVSRIAKEAGMDEPADANAQDPGEVFAREATRWRDAFFAAGGRDVYFVFNVSNVQEPMFVAPIPAGADAAKLEALMAELPGPPPGTLVLHNAVIRADPRLLKIVPRSIAGDRPDIAAFLKEKPSATIEVFIAPGTTVRTMMEIAAPTLPDEIGGHAMTAITRGMKWTRISSDLWPTMHSIFTVQASDDESAKMLAEILEDAFTTMSDELAAQGVESEPLIEALQPKIENDKVLIAIDEAKAKVISQAILLPMQHARAAARRTQSVSQMRQLAIASISFAVDQDGAMFPTKFEQLQQYLPRQGHQIFLSPSSGKKLPSEYQTWPAERQFAWLEANADYVLAPNAGSMDDADLQNTVLLFEKLRDKPEQVSMAYADGSVRPLALAEASKLIKKQTGKTLEEWSAK